MPLSPRSIARRAQDRGCTLLSFEHLIMQLRRIWDKEVDAHQLGEKISTIRSHIPGIKIADRTGFYLPVEKQYPPDPITGEPTYPRCYYEVPADGFRGSPFEVPIQLQDHYDHDGRRITWEQKQAADRATRAAKRTESTKAGSTQTTNATAKQPLIMVPAKQEAKERVGDRQDKQEEDRARECEICHKRYKGDREEVSGKHTSICMPKR